MASRTSPLDNSAIMDFYDFFFFPISTPWSIGLWVAVSLVLWLRNMTVYRSPYKVGLIYAGTKFCTKLTHLVWNSVISPLNFLGDVVFDIKAKVRSLCKHCTASISPSNNPKWHEVCGIFFFLKQFNFRFGPFGFFRFSIRLSIWLRIRFKKMWRLSIDNFSIASHQMSLRAEPSGGTLVCFIRCVKGLMDTCHTPRSCLDVKFLGAHPICVEYLISVNYELNIIKTLELMCRLCDFFF